MDILKDCGSFDPVVKSRPGRIILRLESLKDLFSLLNTHENTSDMSQKERRAPTSQDRAFHILYGTAESYLKNAVKNLDVSEADAKVITQFINELRASNNLGKSRVFKIISVLVNWRRMIPDYKDCGIGDVYQGLEYLREV